MINGDIPRDCGERMRQRQAPPLDSDNSTCATSRDHLINSWALVLFFRSQAMRQFCFTNDRRGRRGFCTNSCVVHWCVVRGWPRVQLPYEPTHVLPLQTRCQRSDVWLQKTVRVSWRRDIHVSGGSSGSAQPVTTQASPSQSVLQSIRNNY